MTEPAPEHRSLPASLARDLDRRLAAKQAEWRSTGLVGRVVRHGRPVWDGAAGTADAADPAALPGPDTQFRMGSITKTFTAVLVMQCRDDGLLALDDRLEQHLPGARHGDLTVRRMLAHLSGLQREPVGDVWAAPEGPSVEDLVAGAADAEEVLPPARRHHYSNLAFALLGHTVGRLRGTTWADALQSRVLDPLGMSRTSLGRQPPYARGYFVDPYTEQVTEEPLFPGNGFAPAAELWSTTTDLGAWGGFLADPVADVLAPDTVEEMCHPQVMYDLDAWALAWGLGLMLVRRGDRVLVGHDGAMPGFLAGLAVRRKEKVAGVVLASTSTTADPGALAADAVLAVLDDDPDPTPPWRPQQSTPPELVELLGVWWTEGTQFVFTARDGHLEARAADAPAGRPPAVFAQVGPDLFRVTSGREHGELLRVARNEEGSVARMFWATYPVTRDPLPFGR